VEQSSASTIFISRWQNSGAAERANYQLFLSELCDLLGVARPDPTKPNDADNAYVFERSVTFHHPDGTTSTGRIDLYKRGCYVLEAKQGVEKREAAEALADATKAMARAAKKGHAQRGSAAWDEAMLKARGQAEQYARALPASEGRPPLLIVVDVGHSIELYSEFTRTGGTYVPFPDPRSHRILLARLGDVDVRETLRLAWTDPQALDPARRRARVTREIAQNLGRLAASLEKSGHSPEAVATFLMRALFTMFAEDVEMLPKDSFVNLLNSLHGHSDQFVPMVEELWSRMKTGGFSTVLREKVLRFNGALFEDATALPLTDDQFELLIEASRADWRDVEPAIFGTLLERALNPIERHKLGAHYTPRAYVERLVMPTIVEPLRTEWDATKAAAVTLDRQGRQKEAAAEVQKFHRRLCEIRVLDPACGSGNFLYVTLEHLKRLEGEALNALDRLGHEQAALEMAGFTVDPHQLLGIEVNPRAAAIAELVLWIGYLQWHFRTRGRVTPPEPIIKNFHNIECRDAVLAYDRAEPLLDAGGQPVTRWDGRTMKKHPVTGEDVPDETARVLALHYENPRPAEWPQADFIVGNPPFIGTARMRDALGDGYTEELRATYPDVAESADFVMYWWHKAALLVRDGKVARFGFITTNSLRQTFNRRVVEQQLGADKLSLLFAIPDHPWVDETDGAAVRIAMTVAAAGERSGRLVEVVEETESGEDAAKVTLRERTGLLHANLAVGANVAATVPLQANIGLAHRGFQLIGSGFIVTREEAAQLGLGRTPDLEQHIREYRNGRDLTDRPRDVLAVDLFGLTETDVREKFPEVYQHVLTRVKPERDTNNRESYRRSWWIFGEPRREMRPALAGLPRYIATVETAKHRTFQFLDASILPDNKLIVIALDDAYFLGVLSSRLHTVWALSRGALLEDRPVYPKTECFQTFPFPDASEAQRARIRDLGESLDAHRKRQQSLHPKLTLTDIYNVLEKLHAGIPLNSREQLTHEHGLVTVLCQLHDDLDAAVAEAYGWSDLTTAQVEAHRGSIRDFKTGTITHLDRSADGSAKAIADFAEQLDAEILTRLVALNATRAAEERAGLIRYLRPSFQNPTCTATQTTLATGEVETTGTVTKAAAKLPWPKTLAEQAQAVRSILTSMGTPADAALVAAQFKSARVERVAELLATLASLGQARALTGGRYLPS
jgi:hypothetical protein